MKTDKKKFASGVNVGSSSILVTFVLLCLVTFAALAFVSANSDYKLSKQTAERVSAYYESNHMAEVYLLNIESQLNNAVSDSNETDFLKDVEACFKDNSSVKVSTSDDDNVELSYSIAVTNNQELQIVLYTNYSDFSKTKHVSIKKWETVSTYVDDGTQLEDDHKNLLF